MTITAGTTEDANLPIISPGQLLLVGGLVWSALLVVNLGQWFSLAASRGERFNAFMLVTIQAPAYLYWWLLTPLVFALVERMPLAPVRFRVHLAWHGVAALAASAVPAGLSTLAASRHPYFQGRSLVAEYRSLLMLRYAFDLITYLGIASTATGMLIWRRARLAQARASRLASELAAARLLALQAQLRPHFLFNALNGIAMLMRRGAHPQALQAVVAYGELLRTVITEGPADVPLAEELAFAKRYLEVEAMRFPDALDVRIDVAPECLGLHVPRLILQPLVENAVRHGLQGKSGATTIRIGAARTPTRLVLEVSDDGAGLPAGFHLDHTAGMGLRNTRSRLMERFGSEARLGLESSSGGGTTVRLELPIV